MWYAALIMPWQQRAPFVGFWLVSLLALYILTDWGHTYIAILWSSAGFWYGGYLRRH